MSLGDGNDEIEHVGSNASAAGRRHHHRLVGALECLAIVATATIAGRLSWFTERYGISVDESTYMALGDIVARGGVPYRDALDRKPPGIFWMFAAMAELFGPWNIDAVHAVAFAMTIILSMLAAWLCARLTAAKGAACLAAVAFALYSACFTREIISCNAEYPMLIACAAAALCLTSSRLGEPLWRSTILAAGAAVSGAVATLFKQYGILVYLPMAVVWSLTHMRADRSDRARLWRRFAVTSATGALGLAVVFGVVTLWFWRAGAIQAFTKWTIFDGFRYMRTGWAASSLRAETAFTVAGLAVAWFPLWMGIARRGPWRQTFAFPILLAGATGALLTTFLSGRAFAHYYLPVAWFASVVSIPGLLALWACRRYRLALGVAVLVPLSFFAVFNTARDSFWPGAKFNRARQAQLQAAARWIHSHVSPGETIAVWGSASQLYIMSERSSGTRQVFADFVSGRQPGFDSGASRPVPGALAEYVADLERNRPTAFVDTAPAAINDYGNFPLTAFPVLNDYVTTNYCFAVTVQRIHIWLRKSGAAFCLQAQ